MNWYTWLEDNVEAGRYTSHPRWEPEPGGTPWALVRDDGLTSPHPMDMPFGSKRDGLEEFVKAADQHVPVKPAEPGPVELPGWGDIQDLW